ncbi:MAG: hypothetical protein ACI8XM_002483 [Haloarculaceae archaeon]|jgi:hypothetical protein
MSTEISSSGDSAPDPARSFDIHHQSIFITETGDDDGTAEKNTVDEHGLLAFDDEPFETTLFHHGVNVDTRQRTTRIDTGGSDEFIDDRPPSAIRSRNAGAKDPLQDAPGLQGTLFADTTVDQRTLDGQQASARFMFEAQQRRQTHDTDEHQNADASSSG